MIYIYFYQLLLKIKHQQRITLQDHMGVSFSLNSFFISLNSCFVLFFIFHVCFNNRCHNVSLDLKYSYYNWIIFIIVPGYGYLIWIIIIIPSNLQLELIDNCWVKKGLMLHILPIISVPLHNALLNTLLLPKYHWHNTL